MRATQTPENNRFAKAVAKALYPPSPDPEHDNIDMLWSVISDKERALCNKIASAVLLELREPTANMREAGDEELRWAIANLQDRKESDDAPEFLLDSIFRKMVDTARSSLDGPG